MGTEKNDFLLGLLVGGALGAAAAMLLSPTSGPEMRGQVKQKAQDAMGRASEMATVAKQKAQEAMSRASEMTTAAKEKVGSMAEQMKSGVQEVEAEAQEAEEATVSSTMEQPA